ncbi:MAG: thiamine ABC transporter substrate binding subunit [Actinomycetes bacterium]
MRPARLALRTLVVAIVLGLTAGALSACSNGTGDADTVTLITHDSFVISKPVQRAFETSTGLRLRILRSGDAGAALNQVILTRDRPLGDAFFGVDNTLLSRALAARVFERYRPAGATSIPSDLVIDRTGHVTSIDYGDVCVNYDAAYFAAGEERALPEDLEELAEGRFAKLLVVENPATSSTGLAFMLASIARFGDGWLDWWAALRDGGVKVVEGWEQAYNAEFSGSAGKGEYPLVVSYATSPPAEVIYADPKPATAPTGNLDRTCFRQVETVGVLRNAEHPEAARTLIDFLLTERFQADVPLGMFVYPVRPGTPVPPEFERYAGRPADPFSVPPAAIARNRDRWIEQWDATVLR